MDSTLAFIIAELYFCCCCIRIIFKCHLEIEICTLSSNTKVNEEHFLNVCRMFIFSIRLASVKLNKLPKMEVIAGFEQAGLVRHYIQTLINYRMV